MTPKRDFKGIWIPKEIWLNDQMNYMEKCLFAEIDSLDNDNGCFASNSYFAEFFHLSEGRISHAISHLKELGYVQEESFDGRIRVLRSNLKVSETC